MTDETRYELDHAGEIIEYQGSLCDHQNELLLELFSQFGNRCEVIETKGSMTKLKITNPRYAVREINVFHGNIRNEKRSPYEKKIQLGSGVDPRQYNKQDTIILGIYVLDSDDALKDAIMVGFPIDERINYPSNPSLRGGLFVNQLLQDAKVKGICIDDERKLVGFRPEFIYFYLDNHVALHYGDDDIDHNLPSTESVERQPRVNNRNLIYFGAPGTGKSYRLNKKAIESFDDGQITRVTFHPDYTYSQFVGSFRPHTDQDESGKTQVYYAYTPGPFIETYVDAVKNPDKDYLLIVEEINRANPAAVFGDIFQLLDRDTEGRSDYPVKTSDELRQYLLNEFISMPEKEKLATELSLPPNMYIWATMNSADQGVFPMDTAFKRRWGFRYMGIDEGENVIEDIIVPLGKTGNRAKWNDFRKEINRILLEARVNEDKLLGPFFIDLDLLDDENFIDTFKSKVLLYLIEDAAKTKKEKVFGQGTITYSIVSGNFEEEGEQIFNGIADIAIKDADDSGNAEDIEDGASE